MKIVSIDSVLKVVPRIFSFNATTLGNWLKKPWSTYLTV